ncbi:MAG: Rieske (2Fe-2S) protein [Candidatus Sericytochromatia bacterium]
MSRIKTIPYQRLQRESRCVVFTAGTEIVVFEVKGRLFAFDNACPHQGMPLEDGLLDPESGTLTCLYHQWCFGLTDGCGRDNSSKLKAYAASVEDGYVWIETGNS